MLNTIAQSVRPRIKSLLFYVHAPPVLRSLTEMRWRGFIAAVLPQPNNLRLSTPTFALQLYGAEANLWRYDFEKSLSQTEYRFEVSPRAWYFALFRSLDVGQVQIFQQGRWWTPPSSFWVFQPAFEPVELNLSGHFAIECMRCYEPVPTERAISSVMVVPCSPTMDFPRTAAEVFGLLEKATAAPADLVFVSRRAKTSGIARKLKMHLDRTYREPIQISDVARSFGVRREVMSRQFTEDYGIPPVGYRNRLRIMDAIALVAEQSMSFPRAAVEVGFRDFSGFSKQLKRVVEVRPSGFVPV